MGGGWMFFGAKHKVLDEKYNLNLKINKVYCKQSSNILGNRIFVVVPSHSTKILFASFSDGTQCALVACDDKCVRFVCVHPRSSFNMENKRVVIASRYRYYDNQR